MAGWSRILEGLAGFSMATVNRFAFDADSFVVTVDAVPVRRFSSHARAAFRARREVKLPERPPLPGASPGSSVANLGR